MLRDAFEAMPFLNTELCIMPIYPVTMITDRDGILVNCRVCPEKEVFLISVLTKQSMKSLKKIAQACGSTGVRVDGKWSNIEFTGNSGEVYRPFLGKISVMR